MAAFVRRNFLPLAGLLDEIEHLRDSIGLCAAVLLRAKLGQVVDGVGAGGKAALGALHDKLTVAVDADAGGPCAATLENRAGAVGVAGLFDGGCRSRYLLFAAEHTVDGNIRDFLFTFYAEHGRTT